MRDTYPTREGFSLPRPLLFPEVRALSDLLTVEGPWDFSTMNHRNGYPQPGTPEQITRPGWDKTVGRFCSWSGGPALPGRAHMLVTPTDDLLDVIYAEEERLEFAFMDHIGFKAIYHPRNHRVLVTADASNIIASRWLAYVSPASVPVLVGQA